MLPKVFQLTLYIMTFRKLAIPCYEAQLHHFLVFLLSINTSIPILKDFDLRWKVNKWPDNAFMKCPAGNFDEKENRENTIRTNRF